MIELHCHMDGSLRVRTVWELAREQGFLPQTVSVEEVEEMLKVPEDCPSLNIYLQRFDLPLKVLKHADALTRCTRELTEDLAAEGLTYAELRFAPSSSAGMGLTQRQAAEAVVLGAVQGMQKCPGIRIGVILCCMRGAPAEVNRETLRVAREMLGSVVCAADLAGAEAIFPTADYAELFREAADMGLPYTIHAGEAAGPESVRAALAMGAQRIGHGILSVRDPELVRELARREIPLEVCVKSNCQTKGVLSLAEHPVRRLFDAGVHVTLSTDNRTVSDVTLVQEMERVRSAFGFTDAEIQKMQEYARAATFLK